MKLWFCLFCLTSYPFIQAQSSVPNIIFILADDLGKKSIKKLSFQDILFHSNILKNSSIIIIIIILQDSMILDLEIRQ